MKPGEITVTAHAHETFNAREGRHDDLVLAGAPGLWRPGVRRMSVLDDGPVRFGRHPDRSEKTPG